MEYKDYYKILGVSRDAKEDEIKRSYRKLARKYHPDVSKEANAEEQFKAVQEAYEVLKDAKKRATYDQLGSDWKNGQDFRPPPGWQGFGGGGFEEADLGGFSDFFSSIFGGGHRQQGGMHRRGGHAGGFHRPGTDEHATIAISLEEAFHGGPKTIQLQVPERTPSGHIQYQTKTLKITLPPGIISGQQLRLANQGGAGMGGGAAGDLYLEIEVAPHRFFSLQGRDVYLTLPITPWEAALGTKVTVPTLAGSVDMKIAPGSQANQKLRLKGKGLSNKTQSADQYVLLQIVTPPARNEAQKALYEKMSQEMAFNPRSGLF